MTGLSIMDNEEKLQPYLRKNSQESKKEGDGNSNNNKILLPRDEHSPISHIIRDEPIIDSRPANHDNLLLSEMENKHRKNSCNCKTIIVTAALVVTIIVVLVFHNLTNKKANENVKSATVKLNWEYVPRFNETSLFNLTWKEPEPAETFLRLDESKQHIFVQENGKYDINLQLNVESSGSLICFKNSRHDKQEHCHKIGEHYLATSVTLPVVMTLWSGDYIWVSVRVDRLYRSDALNYLQILKHPL